ncbi:MAG: hypothetical protein EHM79_14805 [Geobacter sp.]|nr:MAG: hypothetical protein EHM79_14805 [Geobacter sp.]
MFCSYCGSQLPAKARFCNQCGKPAVTPACGDNKHPVASAKSIISPVSFTIVPNEFEHESMQQMNQMLRSSTSITSLANMISKKIGKPWYESCFTSIRTSENQYPKVYELASIASRRIGLNRLPPVYIEADHLYQSATYGSLQDSFINIGTLIPRLLNDRELLFVLGHELGHLLSDHALWTTVNMFLVGQHKSTLMSEGILAYFSNPLKLLEQGVESLISNWMRVAEYTADRAALLVVGDFELARRVLFLLYFKSRRELQEVNIDEWVKSQEVQESTGQKISQIASSTPYLGPRLKELETFYKSARYENLRARIESGCGINLNDLFDEKGSLRKGGKEASPKSADPGKKDQISAKFPMRRLIAGACPHCGAGLSIPLIDVTDSETIQVTCARCKKLFTLNLTKVLEKTIPAGKKTLSNRESGDLQPVKKLTEAQHSVKGPEQGTEAKENKDKARVVKGACPACRAGFTLSLGKLAGKGTATLRCNSCKKKFNLELGHDSSKAIKGVVEGKRFS